MPTIDPYQVLQILPSAEMEVLHAARRMIELNQAYAMVRDPVARAEVDRDRRRHPFETVAAARPNGGPIRTRTQSSRASDTGTRLESGRYAGWTLKDLASHDIDYLKWLARHSSGLRYRREITQILGAKGVAAT